jgi:hypothetical protein
MMSDLDLISKVTGVENVANMALAITFHVEQLATKFAPFICYEGFRVVS